MNTGFYEKKSNYEEYLYTALTSNEYDQSLNNARKAAEAFCKSVIFLNCDLIIAEEFLKGKRSVNGLTNSPSPRALDLNGLINLVTTTNSTYKFIIDDKDRNLVKNILDFIRLLGNKASHDKENLRENQIKLETIALRGQLILLLQWSFQELYKSQIPEKFSLLKSSFLSTPQFTDTLQNETETEHFSSLLKEWLKIVEYNLGLLDITHNNDKVFDLEFIGRRNKVERILVLATVETIDINKVKIAEEFQSAYESEEIWIVTTNTISTAAKSYVQNIYTYTFDELIEENFSLDPYFNWLENYVTEKGVIENFVSLDCEIREEHSVSKNIMGKSNHELLNYADKWLSHNKKDHLSILGDFGTGKTWFSLYYAWKLVKNYKDAKESGLPRPRIPILIFLRDYAKAVSVETLISDFFFRKHEIDLKGAYSAFNFLNKHGKLLIIFDGFDEMSDRINKQKMIDNFWELASIIHGKAKVILTCRNEHFPQIKEGRAVLKAELKESTKHLTGTTPQFETVYLELLNVEKIKLILHKHLNKEEIDTLFKNEHVIDLLKRPIMLDLILDSIKSFDDLKSLNLSTIYFEATKNKLTRDIKEERTFTSLADKYFFMCEISQEMLQNDKLSISYKEFPDLIRIYFSQVVKSDEIDYWRYDMHGQTLLIIDEDGQYKPAHKSFLEFFLTLKYVSLIGVLKNEYLEVLCERNDMDISLSSKSYTWYEYFQLERSTGAPKHPPLNRLNMSSIEVLRDTIGRDVFTKPMIEMAVQMIDWNNLNELEKLLQNLKGKEHKQIGYLATNLLLILFMKDKNYGKGKDFSNLSLRGLDFNLLYNFNYENNWARSVETINIEGSDFRNCDLTDANFHPNGSIINNTKKFLDCNFENSILNDKFFPPLQLDDIKFIGKQDGKNKLIVSSHRDVLLLDAEEMKVNKRIKDKGWGIEFLEDKQLLLVSNWFKINIYDTKLNFIRSIELPETENSLRDSDQTNGWASKFIYNVGENELLAFTGNSTMYRIDINNLEVIDYYLLEYPIKDVQSTSSNNHLLINNYHQTILYDSLNFSHIHEFNEREIVTSHPKSKFYVFYSKGNSSLYVFSNNKVYSSYEVEDEIIYLKYNKFDNKFYCFLKNKIVIIKVEDNEIISDAAYELELLYEKELFKEIDEHIRINRLEDVEFLPNGDLILLYYRYLIYYSLKESKIVNHFIKVEDLSEVSFKNCKGIKDYTKKTIYQNGGIV